MGDAEGHIALLIGGLISLGSTLLTLVVREIIAALRQKREEKRWYAGHFIGRKIDALASLHEHLDAAYQALIGSGGDAPCVESLKDAQRAMSALVRAHSIAGPWLDEATDLALGAAEVSFVRAQVWINGKVAVKLGQPPMSQLRATWTMDGVDLEQLDEMSWDQVSQEVHEARKVAFELLKASLRPRALVDIELGKVI